MTANVLDLYKQDEPDFPKGFICEEKYAVYYPGWTLKQDIDELKKL